jgi:hypothetical protein
MARIIVFDDARKDIALDEKDVTPIIIEDDHSSRKLMERIAWAIADLPASTESRIALNDR